MREVILCGNFTFTKHIIMSKRARTNSGSDSENEAYYVKSSTSNVLSQSNLTPSLKKSHYSYEDDLGYNRDSYKKSSTSVLSHINSTPSLKRSYSSYEDDRSYDRDSYKNYLNFLFKFHINIDICIWHKYASFKNEVRKAHDCCVAWMVRVTLSKACYTCCLEESGRTFIRGKRSLLSKDKFSIESPSKTSTKQTEKKVYPFQDNFNPQFSSNHSYLSKSATDLRKSPSLTNDDQYRSKSYTYHDSHSTHISSNRSYSKSVTGQAKESPSTTFDNQYSKKSYSSQDNPQLSFSHSYLSSRTIDQTKKSPSQIIDDQYRRNSYPFQGNHSSQVSSTHSYPSATDLTKESPSRIIDNHYRRKSYPFQDNHTPTQFSSRSYSKCVTDQTPYSPISSHARVKRFRSALPYYNPSDLITFKSDEGFIDSHCHLDFLFQRQSYENSYSEYQKKHKNTFPDCYKGCLAIFCNPVTFSKKHLWERYLQEENVWASFGCHPHNAKDYDDEVEHSLKSALNHPKVRALGEIGLDYSSRNNCMKELQHTAFKRQLKIALDRKLPLVIHCRDAHDDGMTIMKELVPKNHFIHLHCFTDKWEIATKWLQEFPNLFIGITNVVTFPSAEQVHEVAKMIPLKNLLLETDAPYFIPRPLQREFPEIKHSHPGMAIHVAAQIAAIKDMPLEIVLHATRKNTKKMYNI